MAEPLPIQQEPIPVIDPEGAIGTIDPSEADSAYQQGYRPAKPEEIAAQKFKEEHDNPLAAGALGLARGATAGLSDVALTASGAMTQESLKAYKEQNPISSGAGAAAGFLAPAILTGGATAELGTLGRLAVDAGLGGLASAGGDISEAALGDHNLNAEKVLADIGLGTVFGGAGSLGVRAAESVVPEAFGYAKKALTELSGGLVKATGRAAVALGGDAEKIAAITGNPMEAIRPGALEEEAATAEATNVKNMAEYKAGKQDIQKAQGKEIQGAVVKAMDAVDDAQRTFDKTTRPAVAVNELKNSDIEQVRSSAMNALGAAEDTLTDKVLQPGAKMTTIQQARDLLADASVKVGDATKPEEIHDAMLALKREQAPLAKYEGGTQYEKGLQEPTVRPMRDVQDTLRAHLVDPVAYGVKLAAKNAQVNAAEYQAIKWREAMSDVFGAKDFDELGRKIRSESPDRFASLINSAERGRNENLINVVDQWQKAEGHLVDVMEDHTLSVNQKPLGREGLQDLLKQVSTAKENEQNTAEMLRQGLPKPAPVAPSGPATSLASLKSAEKEPLFKSGAIGMAAHALGLPVAPITALAALKTAPGSTIETLIRVARAVQRTTDALDTGVQAMLGSKVVRLAAVTHGMHSLDLGNGLLGAGAAQNDILDHHRKTLAQIAAQGPSAVQPMPQMQGAAPFTAAAMADKALKQAQALYGAMPNDLNQASMKALAEPFSPSRQSVWEFDEISRVVKDPTSVLPRVAAGVESPQAVAAFKVLWPEMYNEVSAKLMDGLTKLDKPLPFEKRQQLSSFLNTPLDPALRPQNLLGLQGHFLPQPQERKAPLSSGLQKLHLSGSEMTQGQAATAHLGKG